jgi:cellulose synthase operon protein B
LPYVARIGQSPNRAALGGTAAPYGRSEQPVPLIVDRSDPASFSAAATLVARMSAAAGRPIDLDLDISPAAASDRNALFVGPIAAIAPEVLAQVGVAQASRTSWSTEPTQADGSNDQTAETFQRWREELSGSDWRGQVSLFQDWLDTTFGVSLDTLRLRPKAAVEYAPGGDASLLVAQGLSPGGSATWTVVTAPSAAVLAEGTSDLVRQSNWKGLGGHITTYSAATERLGQVAVGDFRLANAEPASFSNYRLIAANWLSANVLGYSLALGGLAIALGLATAFLLSSLGRRS